MIPVRRIKMAGRLLAPMLTLDLFCRPATLCLAYNVPPNFFPRDKIVRRQYVNEVQRRTAQAPVHSIWFPVNKQEIDYFIHNAEDGGELQSDHPGFQDKSYRERRRFIADQAFQFRHGSRLPAVDYTSGELETWKLVYEKLRAASKVHAVEEYNNIVTDMEKAFGYGSSKIPQLQEVSDYLQDKTGFSLRPAPGLLPSRAFLNGLAFRVFHSTQYLRHGSRPFYTPEPDIVHEFVGHAPLLADPDFAALSQEIGLASLGASDDDIRRLAACYWFSVEFGLCRRRPDAPVKAYGAGVLSSLDELLHACCPSAAAGGQFVVGGVAAAAAGGMPAAELRRWEPSEAAEREYPITTLQPRYYVSESLDAAKAAMRAYCRALPRPFTVEVILGSAAGGGGGGGAAGGEGRAVTDRPVVRGPPPAPRR